MKLLTTRCALKAVSLAPGEDLETKPAMSNPNGLPSQKVCHYLDQQGLTLNDILLMRAAHLTVYFYLNKLNLA